VQAELRLRLLLLQVDALDTAPLAESLFQALQAAITHVMDVC
jgi:hypothetical protein